MDPANTAKFPLFISIDGDHQPTLILATSLTFATGAQVIKVQCNTSDPPCKPPWDAYCNLALHYKTLLQLFFECMAAPRLIFLEEDLQVAPDFFSYFESTAPLLDQDKSLYCISAWNDQGQLGRVTNHTALYRTDGELEGSTVCTQCLQGAWFVTGDCAAVDDLPRYCSALAAGHGADR